MTLIDRTNAKQSSELIMKLVRVRETLVENSGKVIATAAFIGFYAVASGLWVKVDGYHRAPSIQIESRGDEIGPKSAQCSDAIDSAAKKQMEVKDLSDKVFWKDYFDHILIFQRSEKDVHLRQLNSKLNTATNGFNEKIQEASTLCKDDEGVASVGIRY